MVKESISRRVFIVFVYVLLTLLGIICLYPVWNVFVVSVLPASEYLKGENHIIPPAFTWQGYKIILAQPYFIRSIVNSVFITVVGTLLSLAVTIPTAYSLSRPNLKGSKALVMIFYFTVLFDGGIIPLYFVIKGLGLINSIWSLILPNLIVTYYLIIMRSFFQSFPESLLEAARIEGLNEGAILWKIVLPLSKAILLTVGLYYAVLRWNDFFSAKLFISKRDTWPLQLFVHNITSPDNNLDATGAFLALGDNSVAIDTINMAAVSLSIIPVMLIYPFIQKYFTKGMMMGSIKE